MLPAVQRGAWGSAPIAADERSGPPAMKGMTKSVSVAALAREEANSAPELTLSPPRKGARRPVTAVEALSTSLPTVSTIKSPYDEDLKNRSEVKQLRRRIKELELELKSSLSGQPRELQAAYWQEVQRKHTIEAERRAAEVMSTEVKRMRARYEQKVEAAERQLERANAERRALKAELKLLQEKSEAADDSTQTMPGTPPVRTPPVIEEPPLPMVPSPPPPLELPSPTRKKRAPATRDAEVQATEGQVMSKQELEEALKVQRSQLEAELEKATSELAAEYQSSSVANLQAHLANAQEEAKEALERQKADMKGVATAQAIFLERQLSELKQAAEEKERLQV